MKRALLAMLCSASTVAAAEFFTDSVGMRMLPVAPGSFNMGERNDIWVHGSVRTRSTWRDSHAEAPAILNDPSGREIYRVEFARGIPQRETGSPGEY